MGKDKKFILLGAVYCGDVRTVKLLMSGDGMAGYDLTSGERRSMLLDAVRLRSAETVKALLHEQTGLVQSLTGAERILMLTYARNKAMDFLLAENGALDAYLTDGELVQVISYRAPSLDDYDPFYTTKQGMSRESKDTLRKVKKFLKRRRELSGRDAVSCRGWARDGGRRLIMCGGCWLGSD